MINRIASMANIYYVRQKEPKGLGHAILCAKSLSAATPSPCFWATTWSSMRTASLL